MSSRVDSIAMYPLRLEPIYQYRLWGGRRLAEVLEAPLPSGPIGESWVLSDRDDHASRVADGALEGWTLTEVLREFSEPMFGAHGRRHTRFPVLLKFLDARQMLSVQVHPSDAHPELLPPGETGKTEAWVVLEAGPESRVYAGLTRATTAAALRAAIARGELIDHLACFTPEAGDAVFLPAGTVHSLGGDVVVFEIQQNSDVTFRLYDWEHVDAETGQPRPLQVDRALACIDFAAGPVVAIKPPRSERVRLFHCAQFSLWRMRARAPFTVGAAGMARVIVCIEGSGELEHAGTSYRMRRGEVMILPACIGECSLRPRAAITVLEIALPGDTARSIDEVPR